MTLYEHAKGMAYFLDFEIAKATIVSRTAADLLADLQNIKDEIDAILAETAQEEDTAQRGG